MTNAAITAYDQVIYPNYTYPQTQPRHLAALGSLLGLNTVAASRCRVLELGCGDGGNLIPMAYNLPGATFLGVDIASQLIAQGNQRILSLGLNNIELRTADLGITGAELGEFDYIICHGIYSWVPDGVRKNILALCRACLAPEGVAYISYNAYPGFYLRAMSRSMLQFHTRSISDADEKVKQSRALLNWLASAQKPAQADAPMSAYSKHLQEAVNLFAKRPSGAIFHDDFSPENTAFYFHEFAAAAAGAGLQYLTEAEFSDTQSLQFSPEVQATLSQLGQDSILAQEQYLDFLTGRNFRQTLLCHHEKPLTRPLAAAHMRNFYFSINVQPEQPVDSVNNAALMRFAHPELGAMSTDNPLAKAALSILGAQFPKALKFADLVAQAQAMLADNSPVDEPRRAELAEFLCAALRRGIAQIHTEPHNLPEQAGEFPVASAIARQQAQHSPVITTLL
ncbi:MAG TPA: class I SAM-dependent methyltransferase, partial [Cellvibrionaceae bacterium]|nr:class I SAM-dependent methyltransferase [Cellvibrionaceae bacterium]